MYRAVFLCGLLISGLETSAADDDPRDLATVIERVRANEAIYKNIEIILESKFHHARPDEVPGPNAIEASSTRARLIAQGDLFYHSRDETITTFEGKTSPSGSVVGYDGRATRLVAGKFFTESDDRATRLIGEPDVAEITTELNEGRLPLWLIAPHTLNIQGGTAGTFSMPLSVYLSGEPRTRAIGSHKDKHIESRFEGMADLDGLRCAKVRCRIWNDGADPAVAGTEKTLWLAVGRNFLPVRVEDDAVDNGKHFDMVGSLSGLEEVRPGVWFPTAAAHVVYTRDPRFHGKPVFKQRTAYKVTKVALDPKHDLALFRDIPFPDGATVRVVKDGAIVREYVHKADH